MKKILITIVSFLVTLLTFAQSPNLMNYQGVARNAVGNVLPNQNVALRLTIRDGSATGASVYSETRNVTTNAFGLFNVVVGSPGAVTTSGTIAGINWTAFGAGSGPKFLQVEVDPVGGTSFVSVGATQLVSVPYAMNAAGAAPVGPAGGDLTGTYPNPQLAIPLIKTVSLPASQLIGMTNSSTTGTIGAITGTSASTDGSANAVTGTISSTSPGGFSAGVRGINNGTSGLGIGVYGSQNGSGWGVYGTTPNGIGVNGISTSGVGVNGSSTSGSGVNGTSSTGSAGVFTNSNTANTSPTLVANTNSASDAVQAVNTGTGKAGTFTINNAANANFAIDANSNGTNATINSTNTGAGNAAATAGTFTVNNAASTADALRAVTNGTGPSWAIRATSTGTNGAGLFISNNATATNNNLQSNTNGLGRAGLFNSTNAASTANGVDVNVAGTGFAMRLNSTNATPKALQTVGGVQLTGIGEAANRGLITDAAGNATWQTLFGAGGVLGNGSLNFVPKWTPSGVQLGNSLIYDDGANVGIGTTTPVDLFHVRRPGGPAGGMVLGGGNTTGSEIKFLGGGGSEHMSIYNNGTSSLRFAATSALSQTNTAGNVLMNLTAGGFLGLGTGTAVPTARFDVSLPFGSQPAINALNTGGGAAGVFTINNSASTGVALGAFTNGDNHAFRAQSLSETAGAAAIRLFGGISNTSDALEVLTTSGGRAGSFSIANINNAANALEATTPGAGFAGYFRSTNVANPKALYTRGGLQFQGIGEGNLKIMGSDASGNATWQNPSALGVVSGSGTSNYLPMWGAGGTSLVNSNFYDAVSSAEIQVPLNVAGTLTAGTSIEDYAAVFYNHKSGGGGDGIKIIIGDNNISTNNNFITFKGGGDVTVGRIEGQSLNEWHNSWEFVFETTFFALDEALTIAQAVAASVSVPPDLAEALVAGIEGAELATHYATWEIHMDNDRDPSGVAYESGNGDYAEWLLKANPDEKFSYGDIVGVIGGKISKDLTGASHFMVISKAPIVLGNMPADGKEELSEKVAFLGQVPIKIRGNANVGDYIVASKLNDGFGIAVNPKEITLDQIPRIVGVAWSTSKGGTGFSYVNGAIGINVNDMAPKVKQIETENETLKATVNGLIAYLKEKDPSFKIPVLTTNPALITAEDKSETETEIKAFTTALKTPYETKMKNRLELLENNTELIESVLRDARAILDKKGIDYKKFDQTNRLLTDSKYLLSYLKESAGRKLK